MQKNSLIRFNICLIVLLMFVLFDKPIKSKADEWYEAEEITSGELVEYTNVYGGDNGESKLFKIKVDSAGVLVFTDVTCNGLFANIEVLTEDMVKSNSGVLQHIYVKSNPNHNSSNKYDTSPEYISENEKEFIYVDSGIYYIYISSRISKVTFKCTFISAEETFDESIENNDELNNANPIDFDTKSDNKYYKGMLSKSAYDNDDLYKFVINQKTKVEVDVFNSDMTYSQNDINLYLLNSTGQRVKDDENNTQNIIKEKQDGAFTYTLEQGTYYLNFNGYETFYGFRLRKPVSELSISDDKLSLDKVGATAKLSATVYPTDAYETAIKWESEYPSVATVDENGLVTAVSEGQTDIIVKTADGSLKEKCTVTVGKKVTGISIDKKKVIIPVGNSVDLKVKVQPDDAYNQQIYYSLQSEENVDEYGYYNGRIIEVSGDGHIKGLSAGNETITFTTDDGNYTASCDIQVVSSYASYQGCYFWTENGNTYCVDSSGNQIINDFKCDGTYTYYFQADGSAMQDRLTYHPDGEHVIYFDEYGHEVFSDFANVKKTIAGDAVDDYCFFDVFGYMYVDVLTYDKTGNYLYYANPYGVLEMNKWFQFSDTVKWADGTDAVGIAGGFGYANSDGTLETNHWDTDWLGRVCYLQGNGVALY
ncbi:MAG: Ig-like domain-containing protein [Lachnospiraceae bacterium]|nr:Ig-like domain-containing protein [Lachnospiraceae bacterium]